MQNIKCSSDKTHQCPQGMDVCCQFCELNYTPCAGKCDGCWNELPMHGCAVEGRTVLAQDLPTPVA